MAATPDQYVNQLVTPLTNVEKEGTAAYLPTKNVRYSHLMVVHNACKVVRRESVTLDEYWVRWEACMCVSERAKDDVWWCIAGWWSGVLSYVR
jgi:hypothetical protein